MTDHCSFWVGTGTWSRSFFIASSFCSYFWIWRPKEDRKIILGRFHCNVFIQHLYVFLLIRKVIALGGQKGCWYKSCHSRKVENKIMKWLYCFFPLFLDCSLPVLSVGGKNCVNSFHMDIFFIMTLVTQEKDNGTLWPLTESRIVTETWKNNNLWKYCLRLPEQV